MSLATRRAACALPSPTAAIANAAATFTSRQDSRPKMTTPPNGWRDRFPPKLPLVGVRRRLGHAGCGVTVHRRTKQTVRDLGAVAVEVTNGLGGERRTSRRVLVLEQERLIDLEVDLPPTVDAPV